MSQTRKHKLVIHHSNLFNPKSTCIRRMAVSPDGIWLAVIRKFLINDGFKHPLTLIDVYKVAPNIAPKLTQTCVEYEEITDIAWIGPTALLTVSKEQTASIFSLKQGLRTHSTITDYGPVLCCKYYANAKILLTGTEYGYVVAYRVKSKGKSIEVVNKMVKINGPVSALDFVVRRRENLLIKSIKSKALVKPGKRKRSDSSDDSEEEADGDGDGDGDTRITDYEELCEISIYGASGSDVVVWDYHRKTVVETIHVGDDSCRVTSVLALKRGDVAVGDSKGTISVFDHDTFTCRQSINIFKSDILTLALDSRGKRLIASGCDAAIMTLKIDHSRPDEFLMFEKIETHADQVTSIINIDKKTFFAGTRDGQLIRFCVNLIDTKTVMERLSTIPSLEDRVKFCGGEMLVQQEKSLVLWKLPKLNKPPPASSKNWSQEFSDQPTKPIKLLLLKTREYVHSSDFSDRWIVYSTKKGLHLFERRGEILAPVRTNKKIQECNLLNLCCGNRYLAASSGKTLHVIDLEDRIPPTDANKENERCKLAATWDLKAPVRHMMDFSRLDMLVVVCGSVKNYIYTFHLDPESEQNLDKLSRYNLSSHGVSFLSSNAKIMRDHSLYLYTHSNQVISFNPKKTDEKDLREQLESTPPLSCLPKETNPQGMIFVTKDQCILYDNNGMYKVNLASNTLLNESRDYRYIIKMDNYAFGKPEQIALVELRPEDYLAQVPNARPQRKFGQ